MEWTGHISNTSGSHEPLLCSNSLLLRTFCAGLFKDSASSTWQIVLVLLWRSSSCSPFVLSGPIIAVYRSDKQQRMLMHISAKWLQCPLEHMSTSRPLLSENLPRCRMMGISVSNTWCDSVLFPTCFSECYLAVINTSNWPHTHKAIQN